MVKNEGVSGSFTIVKISFCNRKELYTVLSYMSLRLIHKGAVGGRKEWHISITRHWASFNQQSILMHIMALLSDLYHNKVSQLPEDIFDKLKNLETL